MNLVLWLGLAAQADIPLPSAPDRVPGAVDPAPPVESPPRWVAPALGAGAVTAGLLMLAIARRRR